MKFSFVNDHNANSLLLNACMRLWAVNVNAVLSLKDGPSAPAVDKCQCIGGCGVAGP